MEGENARDRKRPKGEEGDELKENSGVQESAQEQDRREDQIVIMSAQEQVGSEGVQEEIPDPDAVPVVITEESEADGDLREAESVQKEEPFETEGLEATQRICMEDISEAEKRATEKKTPEEASTGDSETGSESGPPPPSEPEGVSELDPAEIFDQAAFESVLTEPVESEVCAQDEMQQEPGREESTCASSPSEETTVEDAALKELASAPCVDPELQNVAEAAQEIPLEEESAHEETPSERIGDSAFEDTAGEEEIEEVEILSETSSEEEESADSLTDTWCDIPVEEVSPVSFEEPEEEISGEETDQEHALDSAGKESLPEESGDQESSEESCAAFGSVWESMPFGSLTDRMEEVDLVEPLEFAELIGVESVPEGSEEQPESQAVEEDQAVCEIPSEPEPESEVQEHLEAEEAVEEVCEPVLAGAQFTEIAQEGGVEPEVYDSQIQGEEPALVSERPGSSSPSESEQAEGVFGGEEAEQLHAEVAAEAPSAESDTWAAQESEVEQPQEETVPVSDGQEDVVSAEATGIISEQPELEAEEEQEIYEEAEAQYEESEQPVAYEVEPEEAWDSEQWETGVRPRRRSRLLFIGAGLAAAAVCAVYFGWPQVRGFWDRYVGEAFLRSHSAQAAGVKKAASKTETGSSVAFRTGAGQQSRTGKTGGKAAVKAFAKAHSSKPVAGKTGGGQVEPEKTSGTTRSEERAVRRYSDAWDRVLALALNGERRANNATR